MTQDDGDEESVSLGTKVSQDFKMKVRLLAASKDESMSEYVRNAVEKQVEEDLDEGNSSSRKVLTISS